MNRRFDEETLNNLVDKYSVLKGAEKLAKEEVSDCNEQIKEIFLMNEIKEWSSDSVKVSMSESRKEKFDEEKAIEILKKELLIDQYNDVVKTKTISYIDDDALEKLIYNKQFDAQKLATCKTYGEPIRKLTVKKLK